MSDLLPIYLFGIPATAAIMGYLMGRPNVEELENPISTLFFVVAVWPVLLPWLLADEVAKFWRERK